MTDNDAINGWIRGSAGAGSETPPSAHADDPMNRFIRSGASRNVVGLPLDEIAPSEDAAVAASAEGDER